MSTSFLSEEEVAKIGFKSYGKNIQISKNAQFYLADKISLGNNVRVDDFCILSGQIILHDNVHISAYASLFSSSESLIEMCDFSSISTKSSIIAQSDTFDGTYMTNPTVLEKCRKVLQSKIMIEKFALIGAHSCVLRASIAEGTAIGAMSLVIKETEPWSIYAGSPAQKIAERKKDILDNWALYYKNS